ncbi:nose resistant to fluoxetine protein 6-like isoform X2 [Limulus polyphemus]|uniref:Nose resistant to fluoxetine protein 6-like isoform X2 n=1 Tax=Limulus polyphemus TaxID=6850 RepID=A0ABM1SGV1_LIMPO|nr:nose resistant to fluoxetine protein 6-like isoform X2 [Limulus polyphemus]
MRATYLSIILYFLLLSLIKVTVEDDEFRFTIVDHNQTLNEKQETRSSVFTTEKVKTFSRGLSFSTEGMRTNSVPISTTEKVSSFADISMYSTEGMRTNSVPISTTEKVSSFADISMYSTEGMRTNSVPISTTERSPISSTDEGRTVAISEKVKRVSFPLTTAKDETTNVPASTSKGMETSTRESAVQKQWKKTEKIIKDSTRNIIRRLLPLIIRSGSDINVTSACLGSGFKFLTGIRRLKEWAIRMVDAAGKPPGGILTGTLTGFGSYDECVNIVASQNQKELFRGSYCTVDFRPPLPPKPRFYSINDKLKGLEEFQKEDDSFFRTVGAGNAQFFYFLSFRLGVCVPSTCERQDIENIATAVGKYIGLKASVPRCEVKEKLSFSTGQLAVIAVLGVFVALLITGTIVELFYSLWKDQPIQKQGLAVQLVSTFSIYTNSKNLFNTTSSAESLRALHGLKFFSMNWIILGHTYLFVNFQALRNLKKSTSFASDFAFQAISNGFVSVDTFFFVSGFLVIYTTLESVKKFSGRFNAFVFALHRYLRLTPTLLMISSLVLLLPLLGSGPIWHETLDPLVEGCRNWWWTNVLLLNNFIGEVHQKCMGYSWYLCCDMQLFLLSIFVIIPLLKDKLVIGVCVNVGLILLSILSIALITYFKDFPPVQLLINPDLSQQDEIVQVLYSKPYTHLGPYAIGMLLGYVYWKRRHLVFPKYVLVLGWLLATACNMAVVYGVYPWNNGTTPTLPITILYAATHRIAWTLGVAWVTMVCITGQGGIVNKILSWKCLIPLSRVTLEVYLLHPLLQWLYMASLHDKVYTSHYTAVYLYIGHLVIAYALAFACCLAFEAPFYRLQKLVLNRQYKEKEETKC